MKKINFFRRNILVLLFVILYSCNSDFNEKAFREKFKETNYEFVESIMISDSESCETYFINEDNTFAFENDCLQPRRIQLGNLIERNDSTFFQAVELNSYNFFLAYETSKTKNLDNQVILLLDKSNKLIPNLKVNLYSKGNLREVVTTGVLNFGKNQVDSISFPQLEQLTHRSHNLEIPKTDTLKIVLDLNYSIFKNEDFVYKISDSSFILIHPISDLFKK